MILADVTARPKLFVKASAKWFNTEDKSLWTSSWKFKACISGEWSNLSDRIIGGRGASSISKEQHSNQASRGGLLAWCDVDRGKKYQLLGWVYLLSALHKTPYKYNVHLNIKMRMYRHHLKGKNSSRGDSNRARPPVTVNVLWTVTK